MPKGMDLTGEGVQAVSTPKDSASITFAVRALAVIRVHDSDAAKERNLTLKKICEADDYMKEREQTLTACLFRAFGRNCVPVFEAYLEDVQLGEDLEVNLRKHVYALEHVLGL